MKCFYLRLFLSFVAVNFIASARAQAIRSDFKPDRELQRGLKFPNSSGEGSAAIVDFAQPYRFEDTSNGYNELVPYVLRSPDQEEAGSCLYMSLTGIAEWWLAKLNPTLSREPEGDIDLSERHFMNIAGVEEAQNGAKDWKTDSIYLLNKSHELARNRDYRFTKGWYKSDGNGSTVVATAHEAGAHYDTGFNWINLSSQITATPVALPNFKREILFADPESNQWNVGVTPENIVETVKTALTHNKAPVQVIYNHMGYWHSVFVVGFDDTQANGNCPFVERFFTNMKIQVKDLSAELATTSDEAQKKKLEAKITKTQTALDKATRSYSAAGGCHPQGVFYVRDSIYQDYQAPVYDYDPSQSGEESHYGKKIVLHEYDWLRHLSNHLIQISAE